MKRPLGGTRRAAHLRAGLAASLVAVLLSCRREEPKPQRTEPWPAPLASASTLASSTPPTSGALVRYVVERARVDFSLPARKSPSSGRLGVVSGFVELARNDPQTARGRVEVDLTSLVMLGGDAAPDAERTRTALAWLALGAEVPAPARESARIATFELESLEPAREDAWLARGELSLHGMRAPASVELEVSPRPNDASVPPELTVRTRGPLVVSFATHDVRARDAHGAPLVRDATLEGKKLAGEARVSVELQLKRQ